MKKVAFKEAESVEKVEKVEGENMKENKSKVLLQELVANQVEAIVDLEQI